MITATITLATGQTVAFQYSATFGDVAIVCALLAILAFEIWQTLDQFVRRMTTPRGTYVMDRMTEQEKQP
jgi:uncharacterized protein (DUF2147 family)